MDNGENILDSILHEGDDYEDVEMLDVEEGEFVDQNLRNDSGQSDADAAKALKQEQGTKKPRRRGNKKRNKRKKSAPGPNVTDVNRFVLDTCRRLKERSHIWFTLLLVAWGVSAMSDLVKEVDAIQVCGGQMTADGKRQRNGGGILWGIIKAREPNAYREITKRAKEFEKQFKPQNVSRAPQQVKMAGSHGSSDPRSEGTPSEKTTIVQDQIVQSHTEDNRKPVMDRIRVPVSYEDIVDDANLKENDS